MLELLHLFTLFLLVLFGFYVFVADPRSRANQTFAAFISFLAAWTAKDLIFWNFAGEEGFPAGWWVGVSFVTSLLMQFALVVFAWVFPGNTPTPRKKAAILFAPGLVFIPAAVLGLLWNDIRYDGEVFSIRVTPLAYAFVAYVYLVFAYGARVLLRKYTVLRGTQQGQQVGAILWALFITAILKSVANIILPFFGDYSLLPFSSVFALPGVLIYAYAISNFRLFSLQTALDQFRLFPLTYKVALSIASVAVVSFAIFQIPIVWWAFGEGMTFDGWRKYIVFSLVSALVPNLLLVLLIVRSISRPLRRLTLAALKVTDGEYGTEVDLRRTNDELGLLASSFNEMSRKMSSDIEQLRDLNEQLIKTEKLAAMGTLAAGLAHEVNNPLASISSLIQMLERDSGSDELNAERIRMIRSQIQRITRVTGDMMDFARVRPAARTEIDVNDILATCLRLAAFDRDFQALEVSTDLDDGLPGILADADQLQQVFLNLFLNARDAMPDGGQLRMRTAAVDGMISVFIADNGSGIDGEDLKQVFDPFFTTKSAGRGTGLGLAVCYGIISAHGGKISIHQRHPHGTEFRIDLPLESES